MSRTIRWVLLAIGTLVAAYLTFEHYTANATLACGTGGVVDCASVTTSDYSKLLGIPVALLGLLWFVATVALTAVLPGRVAPTLARRIDLAWYSLGMVFVLYLVWAELVPLGKICLWCTVIHVDVLVLFLMALVAALTHPTEPEEVR